MVVAIVLGVVVVVAVVVVVMRSRRDTETIESRVGSDVHVGLVRPDASDSVDGESSSERKCAVCGEAFPTQEELDEHVATYHAQPASS